MRGKRSYVSVNSPGDWDATMPHARFPYRVIGSVSPGGYEVPAQDD